MEYYALTILCTQTPLCTRYTPMTTLTNSSACTIRYSGRIGIAVMLARSQATGTQMPHVKPLSKMNVMIVFPPERSVK